MPQPLAMPGRASEIEFESLRARHFGVRYRRQMPPFLRLKASEWADWCRLSNVSDPLPPLRV